MTGCSLTLVPPLGFSTSSRQLRRAGLDYWEGVDVTTVEELEPFLEKTATPFYFFSSKGPKPYTDIVFTSEDLLIFGSETDGLPPSFWERWPDRFYSLPQQPGARCLNLSTAAGIVVYEAWRQQKFQPL